MNVFLRYEITARELDANILTGLIAASRGHRAIVCDWPMMMRGILLRRRQPGFVHMNSLTPGKSTLIFHRIFKFCGYRISSMDQEAGIQRLSYEDFANVRFDEQTVSSADLVFCWGPDDYDVLRQLYPEHSAKIIMSGSPRVDLWRSTFSSIYASSEHVIEPFVLIVSSTNHTLLSSRLHERLNSRRRSGEFDRNPEREAQLVGMYKEGAALTLAYFELISFLSMNYPELAIIVRAHPSEDPEISRGILGGIDRVRVDTETPISQLIRDSVAVILSGSTVALETVMSGKPLISFQPTETPWRDLGYADGLGIQAKTVEEVHTILSEVLNTRHKMDFKPVPEGAERKLLQKVYFEDGQLAAERMVTAWEIALKSDAQRPATGAIFKMPMKELQYFFSSAFPFLNVLFARNGALTEALSPSRNYKRPPLKRKIVAARVEKMRSVLGLKGSVHYRFRGRRGLVIEPCSDSNRGGWFAKFLGSTTASTNRGFG